MSEPLDYELCPVCRHLLTRSSDYLDGHTLMSASGTCPRCGYESDYDTGNSRETIGLRSWEWSYREEAEDEAARRSERLRALFVRRKELGLLAGDELGWATALTLAFDDEATIGAMADWLDEHGRSREAFTLRRAAPSLAGPN